VSRIVVFGGYGTFGAIVCRELAALDHAVTVAGRDRERAGALARALGAGHSAVAADASDGEACRRALEGHAVAVCCAGPFSALGDALLAACVESSVHYVDIADDRAYVARGRGWDARFRAAGRAAVFGCSSLPGLSAALATRARAAYPDRPHAARATLFIGNRNPKGVAAVQSMAQALGRPVAAPPGGLTVFGDPERVRLPPPFGERVVRTIDTPDYDLLPSLVGVAEVRVKVGFELALTNRLFAVLAAMGVRPGRGAAALLARAGGLVGGAGTSGGAVQCELSWADGRVSRASAVSTSGGQRMAVLPCVMAAHALGAGKSDTVGARWPHEVVPADALLASVERAGFSIVEARTP
jgi:saccharopine dehydrogenase-like NADP-dependent oxidoreductase